MTNKEKDTGIVLGDNISDEDLLGLISMISAIYITRMNKGNSLVNADNEALDLNMIGIFANSLGLEVISALAEKMYKEQEDIMQ